jgi:hypothetical protein
MWRKEAQAGFEAFFARRSEPLRDARDEVESPLTEATGAGEKWMFCEFGNQPTQVCSGTGASVRNVVVGITGALVLMGCGQQPGEGTCERYAVLNEMEVPDGTPGAQYRVRGGTGDMQLRLASGKLAWYTSQHCRPWIESDGGACGECNSDEQLRPSSPAPPLQSEASPSAPPDESPSPPPPPPQQLQRSPSQRPSSPPLQPSPTQQAPPSDAMPDLEGAPIPRRPHPVLPPL